MVPTGYLKDISLILNQRAVSSFIRCLSRLILRRKIQIRNLNIFNPEYFIAQSFHPGWVLEESKIYSLFCSAMKTVE